MNNITSTVSRMFRLALTEQETDNASPTSTRLLLAGPNSCGKTSLLFEYAFSCAEQGETVLFIAPKPITRLPLFVNGRSQPKSAVLKLINFVYLPTYKELLDFFSTVHLRDVRSSPRGRPKHVLIDEFDSYLQEKCSRTEETTRIAKCLAYIIDAVDYFSKIQSADNVKTKVHLLLAETALTDSVTIDRQGLYKHWITDFLRIRTSGQAGQHLFEAQHVGDCKNGVSALPDVSIHYQVNEKYIELMEDELLT